MSEILEHELNELHGDGVCVVRPGFGTQSDSWTGLLNTIHGVYPLKFQFTVQNFAMLFTVEDVVKIEYRNLLLPIIRLKGPKDYVNQTQTVQA